MSITESILLLHSYTAQISADRAGEWLEAHVPTLLFILLGSIILYRIVNAAINRVVDLINRDTFLSAEQVKQRAKTLGAVLDALARFVIFFLAILVFLQNIGIRVDAIIASAGIAGIAFGFGAQSLIRDFISGFFILFENQYSVGDVVQIGSSKDSVEHLSLRTTQLRDFEGKLHTIPNGEIKLVINQSRGWMRTTVDFSVSRDEDVEKIEHIIDEELAALTRLKSWEGVIIEAPHLTGIESFTETAMVFKITALVKPGYEEDLARQLRTALRARFSRENIGFTTN